MFGLVRLEEKPIEEIYIQFQTRQIVARSSMTAVLSRLAAVTQLQPI